MPMDSALILSEVEGYGSESHLPPRYCTYTNDIL